MCVCGKHRETKQQQKNVYGIKVGVLKKKKKKNPKTNKLNYILANVKNITIQLILCKALGEKNNGVLN